MTRFVLGHILVKVSDLEKSVRDYQRLGFTVTMGGVPGKAHNALIYLEDGSFIELYNTSMGKLDTVVPWILNIFEKFNEGIAQRYMNYFFTEEGINDFALDSVKSENYEENIQKLRNKGMKLQKISKKQRVDVNGCKRKWKLCFPDDYQLPFFMGPYNPKVVLTNEQVQHQNGVRGIHSINIAVPNYDYFVEQYKKMTNQYQIRVNESYFYLGSSFIVIKKSDKFFIESVQLVGEKPTILPESLSHGVKFNILSV